MMNVNVKKVIKGCEDICGHPIKLSITVGKNDLYEVNMSWLGGDNSIGYDIAQFEIDKFVGDMDEVLIGKFKFDYERYFA